MDTIQSLFPERFAAPSPDPVVAAPAADPIPPPAATPVPPPAPAAPPAAVAKPVAPGPVAKLFPERFAAPAAPAAPGAVVAPVAPPPATVTPGIDPKDPPLQKMERLGFSGAFMKGLAKDNPEQFARTMEVLAEEFPDEPWLKDGAKWLRSVRSTDYDKMAPTPAFTDLKSWSEVPGFAAELTGAGLASSAPSLGFGYLGGKIGKKIGGRPGAMVGALGGAASASYFQQLGAVYDDYIANGVKPETARTAAYTTTVPMAALDVFAERMPVLRALGASGTSQVRRALIKRVMGQAAKGMGQEGLTEAMQQAVEDAGISLYANKDFLTRENFKGWLDNFAAGALPGAVMGGASGIIPDAVAKPSPGPGPITDPGATPEVPLPGAPPAPDGVPPQRAPADPAMDAAGVPLPVPRPAADIEAQLEQDLLAAREGAPPQPPGETIPSGAGVEEGGAALTSPPIASAVLQTPEAGVLRTSGLADEEISALATSPEAFRSAVDRALASGIPMPTEGGTAGVRPGNAAVPPTGPSQPLSPLPQTLSSEPSAPVKTAPVAINSIPPDNVSLANVNTAPEIPSTAPRLDPNVGVSGVFTPANRDELPLGPMGMAPVANDQTGDIPAPETRLGLPAVREAIDAFQQPPATPGKVQPYRQWRQRDSMLRNVPPSEVAAREQTVATLREHGMTPQDEVELDPVFRRAAYLQANGLDINDALVQAMDEFEGAGYARQPNEAGAQEAPRGGPPAPAAQPSPGFEILSPEPAPGVDGDGQGGTPSLASDPQGLPAVDQGGLGQPEAPAAVGEAQPGPADGNGEPAGSAASDTPDAPAGKRKRDQRLRDKAAKPVNPKTAPIKKPTRRQKRTAYRSPTSASFAQPDAEKPRRLQLEDDQIWDAKGERIATSHDFKGRPKTPGWLKKMQSWADKMADRFDLPPVKVWAARFKDEYQDGMTAIPTNVDSKGMNAGVEIAIKHDLDEKVLPFVAAHELGHGIAEAKFTALPQETKNAIVAEYREWVSWVTGKAKTEGMTVGDVRPYLKLAHPDYAALKLTALPKAERDYFLSFDEWMADQTVYWMYSKQKPITASERFFKGVALLFKRLYTGLAGKAPTPVQLHKFFEGLWDGLDAPTLDLTAEAETGTGGDGVKKSDARISSRFPTNKRATEDPLKHDLSVDLAAMMHSPVAFAHNIGLTADYPGLKGDGTDTNAQAERFIRHIEDNLLWLHDKMAPELRDRAKRWYDGANRIANQLAKDFGIKDYNVAGVLASLSPQKDWYSNVSLAERVLDIHTFFADPKNDVTPNKAMVETGTRIFGKAQYRGANQIWMKAPYSKLPNDETRAMWLRSYDETFNDPTVYVVTPEGDITNEKWQSVPWGSLVEIGKAIRSIRGSLEEVSVNMGERNKVRSFFNNIVDPMDVGGHGDVTIDTHAVAAGLLRALSGSDIEVFHNFGNSITDNKQGIPNVKNVKDTGAIGLYGAYAAGYGRAAERRGLLPRQMQSITWEAIRSLFPDTFKRGKNVDEIDAVWRQVDAGTLTVEQARDAIFEKAGGIDDPAWHRPGDPGDAGRRDAAYQGKLADARISRRGPGGVRPAAGSGGAGPSRGFARISEQDDFDWDAYEGFGGARVFAATLRKGPASKLREAQSRDFEEDLATALQRPGWVVITGTQERNGEHSSPENRAANLKLWKELQPYAPKRLKGAYQGVDQGPTFMAFMDEATAKDFGNRYGQESVLTNRGLVYSDGSDQVVPSVHDQNLIGDTAKSEDYFTTLWDGQTFTMGLDFGAKKNAAKVYHGTPHIFPAEVEVEWISDGRREFIPVSGDPSVNPKAAEKQLPKHIVAALKNGELAVRMHPNGRFRLDKIGQGEGAQVFGWGLYFAENESIADSYRKNLSKRQAESITVNGMPQTNQEDFLEAVAEWNDTDSVQMDERIASMVSGVWHEMIGEGVSREDAIDAVLAFEQPDPKAKRLFLKYMRNANVAERAFKAGKGAKYDVEITRPDDHFLHHDLPLSQQPDYVKKVLDHENDPTAWYELAVFKSSAEADAHMAELHKTHGGRYKVVAQGSGRWAVEVLKSDEAITGQEYYETLSDLLGSDQAASEALRGIGLAGIRYLDQGSRGAVMTEEEVARDRAYLDEMSETLRIMREQRAEAYLAGVRTPQTVIDNKVRVDNLNRDIAMIEKRVAKVEDRLEAAENVTHNYVVFDESALEIAKVSKASAPNASRMEREARFNAQALANAGVVPTFAKPSDPTYEELRRTGLFSSMWHGPGDIVNMVRRYFQDDKLDLMRLSDHIKAAGGKVGLLSDVYQLSQIYYGKVGHRVEKLMEETYKPLIERMGRLNISQERMNDVLYAQHAEERNATMQAIDPTLSIGSGMTDQEAQSIKASATADELTIASQIRDIIKQTNREAYANNLLTVEEAVQRGVITKQDAVAQGLMTPQQAALIPNAWTHYVPLKGWEGEDADGTGTSSTGFNVMGRENKKAFGRDSAADGPMAYIFNDAVRSIIRQEKNEVSIGFLRMVQQNPNPLLWQINRVSTVKTISKVTGLVMKRVGHQAFDANKENVLTVKIGGQDVHVEIFHSGIAAAMKSLTTADQGLMLRVAGVMTRTLSALNTSLNPEWFVANILRDIQTAMVQVGDADISKAQAKAIRLEIMANWRQAFKGSFRGMRHATGPKTKWQQIYEDFDANGGRVNWIDYRTVDQFKADIDHLTGDIGSKNPYVWIRRHASATFRALGIFNSAAENAIRVSAYAAMVRRGVPKQQAASIARDLTVDFNRKGRGGPYINALYMFFNASIQGTVRLTQALGKSRVAQTIAVGYFLMGMIEPIMNAGDDDDDDWYERIPDYIRNRNIIFKSPWAGKDDEYFKIPIPYGLNAFKAMGQNLVRYGKGDLTGMQASLDTLSVVVDAANPLGSSNIANMLAPTILDPLISLWANVSELSGKPIAPDNPYDRRPDSEQYFKSASGPAIGLSRYLNMWGGSKYEAGYFDFSPNTLEYMFGTATGGLGRFFIKVANSGIDAVNGGDFDWSRAPFTGIATGTATDERAVQSEFYDIANKTKQRDFAVKKATKDRDQAEVRRLRKEGANELRMVPVIKNADKQLKILKDRENEVTVGQLKGQPRQDALDRIRKQRRAIEESVMRQWKKLEKAGG